MDNECSDAFSLPGLQTDGLFQCLQKLLPLDIAEAFGADVAEAIVAIQEAWRTDTGGIQVLVADWQKALNQVRAELGQSNPTLAQIESWAVAHSSLVGRLIDEAPGLESRYRNLLRFSHRQIMSMSDSRNWPISNEEVINQAQETGGDSLARGFMNMHKDVTEATTDFHIKRCKEDAYVLGKNIACTEGEVVYQNELIQLIHYRPVQPRLSNAPMLIVPPCINKYYILDLTQELSLASWLLSKGIDLYMISWVNPGKDTKKMGLADYVETGVEAAKEFVLQNSGAAQIHLAGYCIGGLFTALAAASKERNSSLASLTLINTMLNYENPGELEVFLSERMVEALSRKAERDGFLQGNMLSWAFTLLRERQLLWPYWVRRYLLGEELSRDPVMYWNQDASNLSAEMTEDYLHDFYLENRFWQEDQMILGGKQRSISDIGVPTYLLACSQDHIVDWRNSLAASLKIGGDVRTVLASGGHVMGVLKPPQSKKPGRHWVMNPSVSQKLAEPTLDESVSGSWWEDWINWIPSLDVLQEVPLDWELEQKRSIEPAPGAYVKN